LRGRPRPGLCVTLGDQSDWVLHFDFGSASLPDSGTFQLDDMRAFASITAGGGSHCVATSA